MCVKVPSVSPESNSENSKILKILIQTTLIQALAGTHITATSVNNQPVTNLKVIASILYAFTCLPF